MIYVRNLFIGGLLGVFTMVVLSIVGSLHGFDFMGELSKDKVLSVFVPYVVFLLNFILIDKESENNNVSKRIDWTITKTWSKFRSIVFNPYQNADLFNCGDVDIYTTEDLRDLRLDNAEDWEEELAEKEDEPEYIVIGA